MSDIGGWLQGNNNFNNSSKVPIIVMMTTRNGGGSFINCVFTCGTLSSTLSQDFVGKNYGTLSHTAIIPPSENFSYNFASSTGGFLYSVYSCRLF